MPRGDLLQVLELKDGKGQMVEYACAGENVQVKINIADEESVKRGDVLCLRDNMCPVTEIFEAEVDLLELLDYKPILSRGSTCMMHIHTYNDEVEIKDIIVAVETNERGESVTKQKPQYTRSHAKMTCRIVPKTPVCLEKFSVISQMGRFTLRDEGKTIGVGRVTKYKPLVKGVVGASTKVEEKKISAPAKVFTTTQVQKPDMVFDMETGEMKEAPKKMDAIPEGDENDDN